MSLLFKRTLTDYYQALIIDEAQDLSPAALRFLLALVELPERICLTADAAQSLYQRGFSWRQVDADLNVSGRTLPLTPRLVALLRIRLVQLLAERGEEGKEHGTPMSERNLDRQFKTACVKAQIRLRDTGKRTKKDKPIFTSTLKFHHLRHTCLSWLGDTGANDMVIKAIAGHADADVTGHRLCRRSP